MSTRVKVTVDGETKFDDTAEGCTIERYYDSSRRVTTVRIHQPIELAGENTQ